MQEETLISLDEANTIPINEEIKQADVETLNEQEKIEEPVVDSYLKALQEYENQYLIMTQTITTNNEALKLKKKLLEDTIDDEKKAALTEEIAKLEAEITANKKFIPMFSGRVINDIFVFECIIEFKVKLKELIEKVKADGFKSVDKLGNSMQHIVSSAVYKRDDIQKIFIRTLQMIYYASPEAKKLLPFEKMKANIENLTIGVMTDAIVEDNIFDNPLLKKEGDDPIIVDKNRIETLIYAVFNVLMYEKSPEEYILSEKYYMINKLGKMVNIMLAPSLGIYKNLLMTGLIDALITDFYGPGVLDIKTLVKPKITA